MEEAFDYYQYNYCVTLYLGDKYAHAKSLLNRQRNYPSILSSREAACIVYNKERTEVLQWGNEALLEEGENKANNDRIYVDDFMNELYRVYPKYKENHNDKDAQWVLQSVTGFLLKLVNNLERRWLETVGNENTSVIKFHYVFVVPTEWEYDIRETIFRPIFITAGLISENDHPNRLLFFTKAESVVQLIQHPKFGINENMKKSRQYLMCGLVTIEDKLFIDLDSFELKDSLVSTSSVSTLLPRVAQSTSFTIDFSSMRRSLKSLLNNKVTIDEDLEQGGKLDGIIDILINRFLNQEIEMHRSYDNKNMDEELHFKRSDSFDTLGLTGAQIKIIKSITCEEIYEATFSSIETDIEDNIRAVILNDLKKMRTLILVKEVIYDMRPIFPIFMDWLLATLHMFGRKLNYKLLAFQDKKHYLKIKSSSVIEGAGRKLLEKIKVSDTIMPPQVIRRNSSHDGDSLLAIFSDAHPNIVINIDISFKAIVFSCVQLDDNNCVERIFDSNYPIRLQSLENFIKMDVDSSVALEVEERVISFMEDYFEEALGYFCRYDRHKGSKGKRLQRKKPNAKNSVKHYSKPPPAINKEEIHEMKPHHKTEAHKKRHLDDFFTQNKENLLPAIKVILDENSFSCDEEDPIQTQQPKYIKAFLMMYLGYVHELVANRLIRHFGSHLVDKKIGYLVSVEKTLLDDVMGTKKGLRKLLFASHILEKEDDSKKVQIITRGEGLLPALQRELSLNLPLKSYFLQVHLYENHLQLTLNQVVKISTPEEEASAIIIQDEIVPIGNIYNSLCKNIWDHSELSRNLIECCGLHRDDDEEIFQSFFSLRNYKEFMMKIKRHIQENITSNKKNSDVEDKEIIEIRDDCSCSIYLSVRDVIDIAFTPVIKNITSVMSATLVNNKVFGKYDIRSLFILGNVFNFAYDSPLQETITAIIQEESVASIENKEVGTLSYVLMKSVDDLLQPRLGERPFLHECFYKGCLHQVSGDNYAVDFYMTKTQEEMDVSYNDSHKLDEVKNVKAGHAAVILQKGQIINNEGITRTFAVKLKGNFYTRQVNLRLIRYSHLSDQDICTDIVPLDEVSFDTLQKFIVRYAAKKHSNNMTLYIMIKMKPKNHFSSLHFSAKLVGEDDFSKNMGTFVYLGEQLTVAYF